MTIPSNLFIDSPDVQDIALHKLSNDVESWPEEIVQKLNETVPATAGMNTVVKFMKKDDENGTATGSVTISNAKKIAVVPVIIREFMMYPMDFMSCEKKFLPLNEKYFDAIFADNEVFNKIEEFPTFGGLGRFEDANMWNAVYPPSLGRYAYASAGYDILDQISDTIDGSSLKEALKSDHKSAANFVKNGHAEVIKKVANLQPVNMNEFRQGVDNLIPKNIAMLKLEGPNKYNLLTNSYNVYNPAMTPLKRDECLAWLSKLCDSAQDEINEVDQNGEKMLILPEPKDNVFLAKEDDEIPEEANEYDHYSVKAKTGVGYTGVVIPTVVDFDQEKKDLKMFIGPGLSTVQPRIVGVRVKNNRFKLDGCMPKAGEMGTFVYQPDKSHAVATIPVTVNTVLQHDGCIHLKVSDMMGVGLKLKLTPGMTLERIAKCGDTYHIPGRMKWIPMQNFGEVTDSPASYAVKTAGQRLTDRPVTVIPTGYGQYSMRGVDKYARAAGWDPTNMERYQVKFVLASLGAGHDKIAETMRHAHRTGHADLHNLNFAPLKSEKIASAVPAARKMTKIAHSLRRNLIKEASYMDNAQTVDAMLSLNFVNPDNVSKFVAKIPHFKATLSHLGSCLLASRLGVKEIPEMAASTAVKKLVEVVDGLEALRATQQIGK